MLQMSSLSSMLGTYSYTSTLVASHRYSSLPSSSPVSSNFPLVFAVAYRNWSQAARTFPLTEVSQTALSSLTSGTDTSLAIHVPGSGKMQFCLLTDSQTGRSVKTRIYFLDGVPPNMILVTPTCLRNLALVLHKDYATTKCTQFSYQPCSEAPSLATSTKVTAIKSSLLEKISQPDLDVLLREYFTEPRYLVRGSYFCLDVREMVTGRTIHLIPLIGRERYLYFHVEELAGGGMEDTEIEGFLVTLENTRLVQGSHTRMTLAPEDILTSNWPGGPESPSFLRSPIHDLVEMRTRHLKAQARRSTSSCLTLLLSGEEGAGADLVAEALAGRLGLARMVSSGRELVGDTSGTTEAHLKREAEQAAQGLTLWTINEVDLVAKDREGSQDCRALAALKNSLATLPADCIVVGLCRDLHKTDSGLAALFVHHMELPVLTQEDRREVLTWLLHQRGAKLEAGVEVETWAKRTAGLNLADLNSMLDYAEDEAAFEKKPALTEENLQTGLSLLQATRADCLGLASVPNVRWEQVGGLEEAKLELARALEPVAEGQPRRTGVLLYGPPGVGKTLLAKAVATECSMSFISVKGPELLNMYVGQSEENVRQVFARAKQAQPCILFFDELDSLAPNRGGAGDGGGVMDRVVSALLAEMDGLELVQVTVVAATNRPDLVDPALLRPGRLDRLVYLGVTDDPAQQLLILKALAAKMTLASDCNLEDIVALLPSGLTGADLSSLVSQAALNTVRRCIEGLEAGQPEDLGGVMLEDFLEALEGLKPSVSQKDLAYYESLRSSLRK